MAIGETRNWPGRMSLWSEVIAAAVWVSMLALRAGAEPAGWVNIDCGASAAYFDPALNMTWETDGNYTFAGENALGDQGNATFVYSPVPSNAPNTLRRFTGPSDRSCYSLPAVPNTTYLVRATFLPDRPAVKFDLALQGTTIKTVDGAQGDVVEMVLTAGGETTVHVCLLRTSPSNHPYISALELRPLEDTMYASMTREQGYVLSRLDRHNFGLDDAVVKYLRYPDDPYDRVWMNWRGDYDPVNTTHLVDISRAPNKPPAVVMATARRLIGWQVVQQWLEGVPYYLCMYFAELDPSVTLRRSFSVDLDMTPWLIDFNIANTSGGPFIATQVEKVHTTVSASGNITFTSSAGSTDKPILNAIEIYQVFQNPLPFSPDGSTSGSKPSKYLIPAAAAAGFGALLICVALFFFVIRRRRRRNGSNTTSAFQGTSKQIEKQQSFQANTVKFTLRELRGASNDFSKKIGEGGFGPVFYGKLASGKEIAIKVSSETSKQGEVEFRNEVDLLSRIHHKSLVSLIGYCQEKNQMLIYEFLPNGTLRDHLYGRSATTPLSWSTRIHLALDAAIGLEYLHMACSPTIIHRDVKSSNILLTARMEAKVSDFGLSKLALQEEATHVSTLVKGTAGYLDPEYYISQKLTVKSDVYSFGVVLLELICGRPPIDPRDRHPNIIDMVRPRVQAGDLDEIVDRRLQSDFSTESMWKVVEVAMTSVEPKEVHRPNMQQVVQELREAVAMEDQRGSTGSAARRQQAARNDAAIVDDAQGGWSSSSASEVRSDAFSTNTSHTSRGSTGYSQPLAR